MVIRDLASSDLDVMCAINQANVPALGEETLESMEQLLRWSALALGVEVNSTLAGFCLVMEPDLPYASANYRWFNDRYRDFIYLDRVGFATEYQGRGYGSALYAEIELRTQASQFTLEVNLDPPNEGSIRFHQRHGFVEAGQQVTPSGKLVSLMIKQLR